MEKMSEDEAQDIMQSFQTYQQRESELDKALNKMSSNLTPLSEAALAQHTQKNYRNSLISQGFGVATVCAALHTNKAIDGLLGSDPHRLFGVDDLAAAGIAQVAFKAIAPSLLAAITGYLAWRQVDYYLHAEERSRFAILKHEITTDFSEIKKSIKKELATRDKDINEQRKKIYQYVDKHMDESNAQFSEHLADLSKHCDKQHVFIKDLFRKLTSEQNTKNADQDKQTRDTRKLIKDAQANLVKTHLEIEGVISSIHDLKDNNKSMQSSIQKMTPAMERILTTVQSIKQSTAEHKSTVPPTNKRSLLSHMKSFASNTSAQAQPKKTQNNIKSAQQQNQSVAGTIAENKHK